MFTGAKNSRRQCVPFLALPVEALHGNDRLLSCKTRNEREQRRTEGVVVNDAIPREQHVQAAEERVHGGLQMFGAKGGDADDAHSLVLLLRRREVRTAVNGDIMSATREFPANFFVVGLDPAVLRDDAASADESNFHATTSKVGFVNQCFIDTGEFLEMARWAVTVTNELQTSLPHAERQP